ncbi:MAG TPA: response regulator [Candidatus Binataceae bacterium]|nr:response regulator [Candidatus Binataceae bacterium]
MSAEGHGRVLVVDDNPATLYSTSRVLRSADFEVTEAATGKEALDLAAKGTDIVMLDVNLPDIHGFEVCQRLRGDPRTARLPIIHVSATFVTDADKARGLDSGCDGYLTHPVDPPVLIATVNAFLRARNAEQELRESESKFKAVFENALSGILILDSRFNFIEVNPALLRMLGRTREELVGKSLFDFVADKDTVKAREIAAEIQQRRTWSGSLPLVRSSGSRVQLEWYVSDYLGRSVAVITDISERVELEEKRQELLASERAARTEAERANRLKDEFLGNVSHELRTPLNSILLWTKALQHRPDDRAQLIRGLDAIERNTWIQTQLISDLLDVSRITSGKLRLDAQPTDLATVVRSSLEALSPAAAAKNMEVEMSLDPAPIAVSGDPARLQQVVWNLVSNAIKFTPKDGRIQVKLELVDSHAVITVADNGQGIKPELLPYLFERFRQGDSGKNQSQAGLGLGLAIAKHLTELHGGTVVAASKGEGRGATFTVRLPVLTDSRSVSPGTAVAPAAAAPSRPSYEALQGVRVLVVDDDADTCALMTRILEEAGAEVASANSADEALAMLSEFGPQVLVSDIGMPQRDGYDLIREVRLRGYTYQELPAIALTALSRPEDRRRTLVAGFQLHVGKPVDGSELTAAIGAVVGRTEFARELPVSPIVPDLSHEEPPPEPGQHRSLGAAIRNKLAELKYGIRGRLR